MGELLMARHKTLNRWRERYLEAWDLLVDLDKEIERSALESALSRLFSSNRMQTKIREHLERHNGARKASTKARAVPPKGMSIDYTCGCGLYVHPDCKYTNKMLYT
jgi:hypothetical protein